MHHEQWTVEIVNRDLTRALVPVEPGRGCWILKAPYNAILGDGHERKGNMEYGVTFILTNPTQMRECTSNVVRLSPFTSFGGS